MELSRAVAGEPQPHSPRMNKLNNEKQGIVKSADITPTQFQKLAETDTYASFITNKPMLQGLSLAHETTPAEMRNRLIDKLSK